MQEEHILEIAAHVLDMVPFLMVEIAKKMFHKNVRREEEKNYFDDCGKIVDHAEKNNSLSGERLGFDFTAKFGRPIHKTTIT